MTDDLTRRRLLKTGVVGGTVGLAGCTTRREDVGVGGGWLPDVDPIPSVVDAACDERDVVDVRGAIYVPAQAFNLYQMWAWYDPDVVERDLTYATRLNLNAIRTWACFEAWLEDPEAHEAALDHFLAAAEERDLSVLLGLFDAVGAPPTESRLTDTDPETATGVSSPSPRVLSSPRMWDWPREFVHWFMDRYRDDDRLLGIELMNEPGWKPQKKAFARSMFHTLAERRGSVPLTVGSTSVANNAMYGEWGSDIHQFHYNFVSDQQTFRTMLDRLRPLHEAFDAPVWLTEWQRVRHGQEGFASEPKPSQKTPDYSTLAPLIHESGFGNFFWSLMIKPAWVQPQRSNGVVNGLFHEDGAVWSLNDARAIKAMSGDASFDAEERREMPSWAES